MLLKEGDSAPDFTLPDETGEMISLSSFKGKKTVVYFYPKDDTPGCTIEACSFRDANDLFILKGAAVIGISSDAPESHGMFKLKFGLPFYLLSDASKTVIELYGASKEKVIFGKNVIGTARMTFVLDEKGVIMKIFAQVTPEGHAQGVLALL